MFRDWVGSKMKRRMEIWMAVAALLLVSAQGAQAELTVETYCQLSIERLQLARDLLEQQGRLPDALEQAALFSRYGTTAEEYLAFGSANAHAVETHLTLQPELQTQLDTLGAQMDALIAQRESAP
jgi:hypothetical protein